MKGVQLLGLALAAIVSCVSGDLGLDITIQGVPYAVSRAIGAGVQPVISANMTISVNETLDASGVLTTLRSIAADVVTPLDSLLAGVEKAASDKSGDPVLLFENLNNIVDTSAMAVENAQISSAYLEQMIRVSIYDALDGNLTQLIAYVSSLSSIQSVLSSALHEVNTADPPYNAQNVSMIITSELISIYTTALKQISDSLITIGSLISTIARDKQSTIIREKNLNETIDNSLRNLIQVVTNFNRTSYGVYSSVIRASDNSLRLINQSYSAVLSKGSSFNNGNITDLTNFLANTSIIASEALSLINNNTAEVTLQLAYVLGNRTTNISTVLYNASKNISDAVTTSDSTNLASCERKYAPMLQQPGLSPSRLNFCIQSEGASLLSFGQVAVPGLFSDFSRWFGPQVVRINMCSTPSGNCSATVIAAFSDFSSRLENKYEMITSIVLGEQNLALYRSTSCVNTVSSDIQDLATGVQDKFWNCLTIGS